MKEAHTRSVETQTLNFSNCQIFSFDTAQQQQLLPLEASRLRVEASVAQTLMLLRAYLSEVTEATASLPLTPLGPTSFPSSIPPSLPPFSLPPFAHSLSLSPSLTIGYGGSSSLGQLSHGQ
jgi:hypothetical protein